MTDTTIGNSFPGVEFPFLVPTNLKAITSVSLPEAGMSDQRS